jgi:hypothetical protein
VVAPLSSGEVTALRAVNGRVVWDDQLTAIRRLGVAGTLSDIRGAPVIHDGRVYALSHSGRSVAIDLRSGEERIHADIPLRFPSSRLPRAYVTGDETGNYVSIARTSPATARRDLADLVEMGALTRTGERRHARYHLTIPLRPVSPVRIDEHGNIIAASK